MRDSGLLVGIQGLGVGGYRTSEVRVQVFREKGYGFEIRNVLGFRGSRVGGMRIASGVEGWVLEDCSIATRPPTKRRVHAWVWGFAVERSRHI